MTTNPFAKKFLHALTEGFRQYNTHGARSSEKLKPIHQCIAQYVEKTLDDGYRVKSLGIGDSKEQEVAGRYYPKKVDIAVLTAAESKPVCAISFKFVISNYKQNNINYFENMIGETANLRRGGCGVIQMIVLRHKTPYYFKDGTLKAVETLSEKNLSKYIKLYKDNNYPHKPDLFYVVVVDIDEESGKVRYCTKNELLLSDEMKTVLFGELSIGSFAEKMPHLCRLKK